MTLFNLPSFLVLPNLLQADISFVTTGLPVGDLGPGQTTHFQFSYQAPYPVANVVALFDVEGAESDWNTINDYFVAGQNGISTPWPDHTQIAVRIASSVATTSSPSFAWDPLPAVGVPYTTPMVTVTPGGTPPDILRYLLGAIVTEAMILLKNAISDQILISPNSNQFALAFFAAAQLHADAVLPTPIPEQYLLGSL